MSTAIEWTDETWNPVRGCRRVSAGCENCYAELIAARFSGPGQAFEGIARMRRVSGPDGVVHGVPQWTGNSAVVESRMLDPLRWRRPRRVFVNSMSDLFYEQFDDETIARVFAVMRDAPRHTFQVLTKRPERMLEWVTGPGYELTREAEARLPYRYRILQSGREWTWPLPNVWKGTSVENQKAADERIPKLLDTPAAVRFLSCEPLLGPPDLWLWLQEDGRQIDWVIVGGESGPGARPCDVAWITAIVADCNLSGVPCFVKQLGKWIAGDHTGFCVDRWLFADGTVFVPPIIGERVFARPVAAVAFSLGDQKNGNPARWPQELRVREFPGEVPA